MQKGQRTSAFNDGFKYPSIWWSPRRVITIYEPWPQVVVFNLYTYTTRNNQNNVFIM